MLCPTHTREQTSKLKSPPAVAGWRSRSGVAPTAVPRMADLYCCRGLRMGGSLPYLEVRTRVQGGSRPQGAKVLAELPGGRHTDVAVAVGAPVVVDAEPVLVEVPEVHPVAVGIHIRNPDVDRLEEAFVGLQVVDEDGLSQHAGTRHFLDLGEQLALVVPGHAGRIRHRGLANQVPAGLDLGRGELLALVPRITLGVEQRRLGRPHLHEGDASTRHEDVRVPAGLEHLGADRHTLVQGGLDLLGHIPAEQPLEGVHTVEVVSHDGLGLVEGDGGDGSGSGIPADVVEHRPSKDVALAADHLLGISNGHPCSFESKQELVLRMDGQSAAHDVVRHHTPPFLPLGLATDDPQVG